jgi:tetratricopeptide (TPR) repeat protein
MDAVTYPKEGVVRLVNNYLIPLRIIVQNGPVPEDYHYLWTPTVAVLSPTGKEVQRSIGYLGPDEFIAWMQLGIAKVRLDNEEYDTAMIPLKSLMETYPESSSIPEAIYFSGVAAYKKSDDPSKLKEAYERLLKEYPDDIWTERAYPYRLI